MSCSKSIGLIQFLYLLGTIITKESGMNKNLFLVLIASSAIGLTACGDESLEPRLQYYVEAQEALAADDFPRVQQAMGQLQAHFKGELGAQMATVAGAEDIETMRLAFRPLSDEVVKVLKVPQGYALTYCPMVEGDKKGYWIQKVGEIANPYFGASMLHCGAFEE